MYTAKYINPQFQFQIRSWRLVLEDSDGILPRIQIEKSFSRPLATVAALTEYATLIASQTLAELDPPQELEYELVPEIDLPAGKVMTV